MKPMVGIIGHFGGDEMPSDGQSIKTIILTEELERVLGSGQVVRINTYKWKKHPVRLISNCIRAVATCKNVIFMTDQGGIKVLPWLLHCANITGKCRLHYVVVGGWLPHFAKNHCIIKLCLKKFDGIYVETRVMKKALEELGLSNVILMPNFKPLTPISAEQLTRYQLFPFRFCTFSRVMMEKGIENAVNSINAINAQFGRVICVLDIYGQVDPGQTEWFQTLASAFPPEIRYKGVIDYNQSVEVLKDYFVLLFPTEFYTEGIPGTIIDAYASALPVVTSQWESFSDVVDHGFTGIGYPFNRPECLKKVLISLINNPEIVHEMRANCLQKACQYLPNNVMDILISRLI